MSIRTETDPDNSFLRLDPSTSEAESTAKSFRQLLGVPPSTASTSDSALIIIDAQNEYASGILTVTNAEASGAVIASLLEKYRAANGKIVHVLHKTPDGTPVFTPGTALAEPFKALTPKEGEEVIWKLFPSSFAETNLQELLKGWGINKVVLVGYMAHVCVSTTARDGEQRGFDILVVEDGVGDRDIPGATGEEVTSMVLKELADCFGTIIKSADVK
ncbi:Isochorismatase hydrolase [Melanomma pulvis-pyrius CBS 109.77]|uniref:Isochorismatase hydrolase n=1 Tax=Melanomma pulvis-pyrius CBS 109.77 TaxID=1314802 RepID=A0A6A6XTM9_9PLEO|nr:Isochorismatase hydrolase [Melanomma pulvis-pyrius CBS 109.77]